MAVKKSTAKGQDASAAKPKGKAKAAAKKAAVARKEAAPKKSSVAKGAAPKKKGAAKKAAPIKLSASQSDLLQRIGGAAEPGYRIEKKAEQRSIDALQERKLIKRGPKHKESGTYHYAISNAGRKHLGSQSTGGGGGTGGGGSGGGGGGSSSGGGSAPSGTP